MIKTPASVERWFEIMVGGIAAAVALRRPDLVFRAAQENLLDAILTIMAIAIGFVATAQSILLTLNNRAVRDLKRTGTFRAMIKYMSGAIRWSFVAALVTAAMMVIAPGRAEPLDEAMRAAWVFFVATAAASCYKVLDFFSKLLDGD